MTNDVPRQSAKLSISLSRFCSLEPALVLRLLRAERQIQAELARHQMQLEDFTKPYQLERLYCFLAAHAQSLSRDTVVILDAVDGLASASGRRELLRQLGELSDAQCQMTPASLALDTLLTTPSRARTALQLAQTERAASFRECFPATPAPFSGDVTEAQVAELRTRLGAWYASAGDIGYAHVHAVHEPDTLKLYFGRGKTPELMVLIERDLSRDVRTTVSEKLDQVHIDRASGRLSVKATLDRDRQFYRELVGELLFADPQHFAVCNTIDLSPLERDLGDLFSAHPCEGIESARLTEVTYLRGGRRMTYADADGVTFRSPGFALGEDWRLGGVKIRVKPRGNRPRTIALRPPDWNGMSRRGDTKVLTRFLHHYGLLVRPMRRVGT